MYGECDQGGQSASVGACAGTTSRLLDISYRDGTLLGALSGIADFARCHHIGSFLRLLRSGLALEGNV